MTQPILLPFGLKVFKQILKKAQKWGLGKKIYNRGPFFKFASWVFKGLFKGVSGVFQVCIIIGVFLCFRGVCKC